MEDALGLRPRGHWDRRLVTIRTRNSIWTPGCNGWCSLLPIERNRQLSHYVQLYAQHVNSSSVLYNTGSLSFFSECNWTQLRPTNRSTGHRVLQWRKYVWQHNNCKNSPCMTLGVTCSDAQVCRWSYYQIIIHVANGLSVTFCCT
jgi:hypothetical protein